MLVKVTKDTVKIIDEDYILNKGEYKVNRCYFEFSDDYTDDLVKKAIFEHGDIKVEMLIANNECDIPYEVLNFNTFELRVYAYQVDGEDLILRYSPTYTNAFLREGSYDADATQGEEITPSQYEQYEQALNDGLVEVNSKLVDVDTAIEETNNLNINVSKLAKITTVALTKKDSTVKTVQILDGEDGSAGPSGKDGADGITPTIGDNGNWYLGDLDTGKPSRGATGATGPAGADGIDGYSPIANVNKSGNTATISITDKNGTTTATINDGTNGIDGQDGVGVVSGGTTGQVLAKKTNTDYDTEWIDISNPDLSNYYTKNQVDNLIRVYSQIVITETSATIKSSTEHSLRISLNPSEITQNGTPSPDSPIPINTITGDNTITIANSDNTQSQNYFINLGNIEYCKFENAEDEIYRDNNGDWYFEKHVTKKVLDGTEDWLQSSYSNNVIESVFCRGLGPKMNSKYLAVEFPYNSNIDATVVEEYCGTNGDAIRLGVFKSRLNTPDLAGFKTWLSQNNVTVYFELATPETTQITDEALTTQLENLYQNALSYIGTTNILQINTDLPINLNVEFIEDLANMPTYISQYSLTPISVINSKSTCTITNLVGNYNYKLSEITSLTIDATTTSDLETVIYFQSGSTATNVSLPTDIINLGDAPSLTTATNINTGTCNANKNYIIAILNNIAIWKEY